MVETICWADCEVSLFHSLAFRVTFHIGRYRFHLLLRCGVCNDYIAMCILQD